LLSGLLDRTVSVWLQPTIVYTAVHLRMRIRIFVCPYVYKYAHVHTRVHVLRAPTSISAAAAIDGHVASAHVTVHSPSACSSDSACTTGPCAPSPTIANDTWTRSRMHICAHVYAHAHTRTHRCICVSIYVYMYKARARRRRASRTTRERHLDA
jgi:hypothetical protein